ncbi:hypothetical protein AOLI_G00113560 [Acnodon oligacanthus]
MHHLSEKVKKHETSKLHMDSCLKFSAFGNVSIATQLDESYTIAVHRHNDEVSKNRHILSRLIDCVKLCGAFKSALRAKMKLRALATRGFFVDWDQDPSHEKQQVAIGTTKSRRSLGEEEKLWLTKEVCDTILVHAKERFSFTDHLVSATLLQGEMFEQHRHTFLTEALNTTVVAYPMLNKAKLKTELRVLNSKSAVVHWYYTRYY